MKTILNLSVKQLRRVLSLKKKLETLQNRLEALTGSAAAPVKRGPRKMSAVARAKIAAAQRARWAKQKSKAPKTTKRKMSAAGRAAIVAAQKARWAKIKSAKK